MGPVVVGISHRIPTFPLLVVIPVFPQRRIVDLYGLSIDSGPLAGFEPRYLHTAVSDAVASNLSQALEVIQRSFLRLWFALPVLGVWGTLKGTGIGILPSKLFKHFVECGMPLLVISHAKMLLYSCLPGILIDVV